MLSSSVLDGDLNDTKVWPRGVTMCLEVSSSNGYKCLS